ncbi:acyl dehydrogenase [Fusarium globosum]|uniref:Acyl dehydrogenase n=1 Tax=Fusarium globosum TaxID=78864 RepID=A0A8H5Y1R6_9HYPO|nr:acyl dehydrogenase [Fusarium globosum]
MSSNELPQRPKRKHSEDETEDDIIEALRRWKKRELSPESSKQAETLLDAATKSRDNSLLQSSFDFFEAKQKQKQEAKSNSAALANKIQDLEAQLQQAKAELEESQAEERRVQAQISDLHFMLEYGDWYGLLIKAMRPHESKIQQEDFEDKIRPMFVSAHHAHATQVRVAGMAEAAAENRQYTGPNDEQKKVLAQEFRDIQPNAQRAARWDCLNGRQTTSSHEMIEAEKKSILEWRENGEDQSLAPGTPFLDRIERMCLEAGVSRVQCLDWVQKYAERNSTCHNPPPKVSQFWKQDAAGVDIEVEEKEAHTAIDWAAMKSAVENRKADIEVEYSNGILSDERRVYILELMDHFWSFYSNGTEPDGTPTPTAFAKSEAKQCWGERATSMPNPPQDYLKEYHSGKWDDLQ